MVYKIEDVVFTGDTLISGVTGSTLSQYSHKLLCKKSRIKFFHFLIGLLFSPDTVLQALSKVKSSLTLI